MTRAAVVKGRARGWTARVAIRRRDLTARHRHRDAMQELYWEVLGKSSGSPQEVLGKYSRGPREVLGTRVVREQEQEQLRV